jgi:hypothetical protein
MSVSSDNTGQLGVNAVEAIILSMGWKFRRQLESDFGVDAQIEIVEDGKPTGQLIGLQIKCGSSYFKKRGNNYVFYGKPRHLDYWDAHCLPVLLVLHDPDKHLTVWCRVERHRVTVEKSGSWSIEIPSYRTLDERAGPAIAESIPRSDPESMRRRRMALDADLIRRVAEESECYLTVDEWVNKSLNFRSATLGFGEPSDSQEQYSVEFYLSSPSVSDVFDELFPWLSYTYCEDPEEFHGEIVLHTFSVELNALGQAFLALEDFYRDGPEPSPELEYPEPTEDSMGEDEWEKYQFHKALEADWEAEFEHPNEDARNDEGGPKTAP